MSNVVDKIINKVENALHKDSNTTTTTTTAPGTTHHQHHHGAAVGTGSAFNGPAPTTAGPHRNDFANAIDPRVDSDADGRTNAGLATHGLGGARSGATGPAPNTAGPHRSDMLNKVDPRVDSDADNSRNAGMSQYGPGGNRNDTYNSSGGVGTGNYGGAGAYGANASNGPHSSNLANKLDPRVDSDFDGNRNAGMANYGPGANNNSGFDNGAGYGNAGGFTGSTGATGANVANNGPHNSSLLNKLDPRVDSDADGSRNAGMAQQGSGGAYNDGFANSGPGGRAY